MVIGDLANICGFELIHWLVLAGLIELRVLKLEAVCLILIHEYQVEGDAKKVTLGRNDALSVVIVDNHLSPVILGSSNVL